MSTDSDAPKRRVRKVVRVVRRRKPATEDTAPAAEAGVASEPVTDAPAVAEPAGGVSPALGGPGHASAAAAAAVSAAGDEDVLLHIDDASEVHEAPPAVVSSADDSAFVPATQSMEGALSQADHGERWR